MKWLQFKFSNEDIQLLSGYINHHGLKRGSYTEILWSVKCGCHTGAVSLQRLYWDSSVTLTKLTLLPQWPRQNAWRKKEESLCHVDKAASSCTVFQGSALNTCCTPVPACCHTDPEVGVAETGGLFLLLSPSWWKGECWCCPMATWCYSALVPEDLKSWFWHSEQPGALSSQVFRSTSSAKAEGDLSTGCRAAALCSSHTAPCLCVWSASAPQSLTEVKHVIYNT